METAFNAVMSLEDRLRGNNELYATDEVDGFRKRCADSTVGPYIFRNRLQDDLVPYPEESFAAFKSSNYDGQPEFFLHKYKEFPFHFRGIAVAITCKNRNKTYMLSAHSDCSVILKEGEPFKDIPEISSEIIFYQKEYSKGHDYFQFESSMKENFYLGFSVDDQEKILKLKPTDGSEPDETIQFSLVDKQDPSRR